ncbi:MAG TPA: isocitrate lyase/phosphoenolpyruvate mutase family protein [Solirubrobacteraceae bacterium]|nr:isocitrate lyase/phosphoenolpyruvate mutase family protein [Solirubrobacteraceae bacterium]
MSDLSSAAADFLALHHRERPLLLANAWDPGSARLFASLGFEALATTSSGYAASLGRLDYGVGRDEAIAHAAALASAGGLPLSADLENGFADDPEGVAETVALARRAGLAGCSVEDWCPSEKRIYDLEHAVERVAAAAAAAHDGNGNGNGNGSGGIVLTARAENFLRGRTDLDDTIKRLRCYEQAGADVLYAPAVDGAEQIAALVAALERPVNVLARETVPPVDELAAIGVARISVGGSFAFAALAAAGEAARELLDGGTYGFTARALEGGRLAREAFSET